MATAKEKIEIINKLHPNIWVCSDKSGNEGLTFELQTFNKIVLPNASSSRIIKFCRTNETLYYIVRDTMYDAKDGSVFKKLPSEYVNDIVQTKDGDFIFIDGTVGNKVIKKLSDLSVVKEFEKSINFLCPSFENEDDFYYQLRDERTIQTLNNPSKTKFMAQNIKSMCSYNKKYYYVVDNKIYVFQGITNGNSTMLLYEIKENEMIAGKIRNITIGQDLV